MTTSLRLKLQVATLGLMAMAALPGAAKPLRPRKHVAPTFVAVLPVPRPSANTDTEAGCPFADQRCLIKLRKGSTDTLPVAKVAGLGDGRYHSASEACYSREILRGARRNVAAHFNRSYSIGRCAVGVRTSLGAAGVYAGYSLGRGAIDYAIHGKLEALGFKNYIREYPTPDKAPPGAILVFGGQHMQQYMSRGKIGRPAGDWVGHITIRGDAKNGDDFYYTDGKTKQPSISWLRDRTLAHKSQRRPLVAVYLMQKCTGMCKSSLRNKCG